MTNVGVSTPGSGLNVAIGAPSSLQVGVGAAGNVGVSTPAGLDTGVNAAQVRDAIGTLRASFAVSVAGNVITLVLGHAATAALPLGALWDCQQTDGSGLVTTLITGWIRTTPQVTQP